MRAAVIIIILLLSFTAQAQKFYHEPFMGNCSSTEDMLDLIKNQHNEVPISGGELINGNGHLFIYRKKDRSTWSMVIHFNDGHSCLLSAGRNWQFGNPFNLKIIPPPDGTETRYEQQKR
jgi:hypothetical protein|tara:strand:- start:2457 stop:2813 length:357 start_codon:yes stop_codon:yes gene_type:complete